VPSDTHGLRCEDVDVERRVLLPCRAKTAESRGVRPVPMAEEVYRALVDAGWEAGRTGPVVDVSSNNVARTLLRAVEASGVRRWPMLWKTLRASCEADWVDAGVPERTAAEWAGHSSMVSLRHYRTGATR